MFATIFAVKVFKVVFFSYFFQKNFQGYVYLNSDYLLNRRFAMEISLKIRIFTFCKIYGFYLRF